METIAYNIGQLIWMIMCLWLVFFYYLPTIVAFRKKHTFRVEILVLNTVWFLVFPYFIALYLLNKK